MLLSEHASTDLSTELSGKTVVVDTSVFLTTGVSLLHSLKDCKVIIPSIVIKELEDKRTHATLGFMAREWLRLIESLRKQHGAELSLGILLEGQRGVTLRVEPNHTRQTCLPPHLQDGSNDSTILAVAKNLMDDATEDSVAILSNDAPLRIHATLDLNMEAYEYNRTLADGVKPFTGVRRIDLDDADWIRSSKVTPHGPSIEKILMEEHVMDGDAHREYVEVWVNGGTKPVATYMNCNGLLREVPRKSTVMNVVTRSVEQDVALEYLLTPADELPVVSLGGGAGTGKTLLAVASAISEIEKKSYDKIIVFRSLHEMGKGQELGFLPGDVNEKMEAWAGAVYDAIDVLASLKKRGSGATDTKEYAQYLRTMVEVSPITYLRGRSLNNAYIILDEAQNFSRSELLNILSRTGENTKMVLCFDDAQVDSRFLQSGSRADIWSVVNDLKGEDIFGHITLRKTERSRIAEIASKLLESTS